MLFVVLCAWINIFALIGVLPTPLVRTKRGRMAAGVVLVLMIPIDYSIVQVIRNDPEALKRCTNVVVPGTKFHPFGHQACV